MSLCICRTLNDLSCSCTARGVVQLVSMRPDIASSPLEVDHWKTSHLPKLLCSSMSSERYCRQVSTGIRQPRSSRKFLTSVSGAGTKMALAHGNHCGPLLVMHQQHVTCLCAVAASRDAWEGANATVSVSDAQSSANAKVGALIMKMTASNSTPCKGWRHKECERQHCDPTF